MVILNSTDPYLPAFVVVDSALRKAITAGRTETVEFYGESLDMHRFERARLESEQVSLLRTKYRDLPVDVVVAAAPIALDFAQYNRAGIWPGATIVFHSVPTAELRERRLDPATTGIPVQLDFENTLELALKLHPATKRIAVISGVAETDRRHLTLAEAQLERHARRFDIDYLVGLTLAETIQAVAALPEDAMVLYLTVFRDGAGAPQVPREVLETIAAVARVPVFGVFETYVGHGIAAGSIASYEDQGRRAGELVARVLDGDDPQAIDVQPAVAGRCIADWRRLRHWRIDLKRLPADCELRFREVTAWDQYRWQIMTALTVILAQAALIVALILNRRRLWRLQKALADENDRRREMETIAAGLQGRLASFGRERSLGTLATTIAHEINQPLIAIQNYAQAARRRLLAKNEPEPKLVELVGKIGEQAERAGAITRHVRTLVNHNAPELRPVALAPLVEDIVRILEPECEAVACRIACELPGDLPLVLADSLQVQLVLVNLLHNAMHHLAENSLADQAIQIAVRRLDDHELQVSVVDRGSGVRPERVRELFEPFCSDKVSGMGMGLAICRDIIDAHGGRIWYDPNPAGGAIFRFTLRKAAR